MLSIRSTYSSAQDAPRLKRAFLIVLIFIAMLWVIKILDNFFGLNLWKLGVNPSDLQGLIGIFTSPLIHGSYEHLISNTPAIIILGTALIYGYPRSWWIVLPIVWVITGLGVWFTARPVFHFGASGLTYGLMFFIFIIGILRRDRVAIALSLLVFFLYGTMIWGIFPHKVGISNETHLWGAGLGALCAIILRNRDPSPPVKRYEWEDEDVNDQIIGDEWNETHEKKGTEPIDKIE